jgi:hypothetical protein
METPLSKIDVARRQLVTAIRLLFDEEDSVSVFSLAANAWEIIDVLCNKEGVVSLSNQSREQISSGKDLKYDYINSPYRNFFKHADRDPEAVLPHFNESDVDALIFLAVEDYIRLQKKSPIELQVFQLWYMSIYSDKLTADALGEILEIIESTFPDIGNLSRVDRLIMGKQVLLNAKADRKLQNDERTEQTTLRAQETY